jgi:hypothetical protein
MAKDLCRTRSVSGASSTETPTLEFTVFIDGIARVGQPILFG